MSHSAGLTYSSSVVQSNMDWGRDGSPKGAYWIDCSEGLWPLDVSFKDKTVGF